jgi:hypothetical protein
MECLRRIRRRLVREVCYWICDHLDGKTGRPTTRTKLTAGDATAIIELVDIERVLAEPELPEPLAEVMELLSPADWKEVATMANFTRTIIGRNLEDPRWSHLRYIPDAPSGPAAAD